MVEITPKVVKKYQTERLKEHAGPKSINDEVMLLLRLCGDQGDLIRVQLRREKSLKLRLPPSPGRPYSQEEKSRMLEEARKLRTPQMSAALALDLNTGLRDKELREIRWEQIDLVHKKALTVGTSEDRRRHGARDPANRNSDIARSKSTPPGTHAALGNAGLEWFVLRLRDTATNEIRRAPSRRSRRHGQRFARGRGSRAGGMIIATRWSPNRQNRAQATR